MATLNFTGKHEEFPGGESCESRRPDIRDSGSDGSRVSDVTRTSGVSSSGDSESSSSEAVQTHATADIPRDNADSDGARVQVTRL